MTTSTSAGGIANQMGDSARRVADQTKGAWSQVRENPSPATIMKALEGMPATTYVYASGGAIGLSLALRLLGSKDLANFVGLWPPSILALAMLNKRFRPSQQL